MQVRQVAISNFRGVREGVVSFFGNALLVGGNSVGKSTVCDALDLVLGPERLFRRPIIDEYDFFGASYRPDGEGRLPEVRIDVVLTNLGDDSERRFRGHLRRWDEEVSDFVAASEDASDIDKGEWCLPVVFIGRYNPQEDDFEAGTFFAHPQQAMDELSDDGSELGAGLRTFTREDKRLCGFLYLRAVRTGTRALSFHRGSLIDTIVRLESDTTASLFDTAINDLDVLTLAASNDGLSHLRSELRQRIEQFFPLAVGPNPLDVKASDLTREHVRDVMRLFVATQPGTHRIPFNRLSTGTLNILVFALLTYIAELGTEKNVIFVMEEPEIALPPHTQRRLIDFVTERMGQTIITSHSPYIIERFAVEQIVALLRGDGGDLTSSKIVLPARFKLKRYRDNRRQFAEVVLARAVIVVEGSTEAVVTAMAADILEADPTVVYEHPDIAGISIFDAQGDSSVPLYAPLFKAMRKSTFGLHDKPKVPFTNEQKNNAACFDVYLETTYSGIEELLSAEVPLEVIDRFLAEVATRPDNPQPGFVTGGIDEEHRRALAKSLLQARKGSGDGYAAILLSECRSASDLPQTIRGFLTDVDTHMRQTPAVEGESGTDDADALDGNEPA